MNSDSVGIETQLRALVDENSDRLTATWHHDPEGVSWVSVVPAHQDACALSVAWSTHEIVAGFDGVGRIELGPADEDEALAIVRAVLRGSIFTDARRKRIWVELEDDTWVGTGGPGRPPVSAMQQYAGY